MNNQEQYMAELSYIAGNLKEFKDLDRAEILDIGLNYVRWDVDAFIDWIKDSSFLIEIVPLLVNTLWAKTLNNRDLVDEEIARYIIMFVRDSRTIEYDYDEKLTEAIKYSNFPADEENERIDE